MSLSRNSRSNQNSGGGRDASCTRLIRCASILRGSSRQSPWDPTVPIFKNCLRSCVGTQLRDVWLPCSRNRMGHGIWHGSPDRRGIRWRSFGNRTYATLHAAWWALFRRRWEDHTGQALVIDEDDRLDPLPAHGELTLTTARKPILGYANKFSVENGHSIAFKVHADVPGSYQAEIVRLRCADHVGVGLKTAPVATPVNRDYPARRQTTETGSFVEVGRPTGSTYRASRCSPMSGRRRP